MGQLLRLQPDTFEYTNAFIESNALLSIYVPKLDFICLIYIMPLGKCDHAPKTEALVFCNLQAVELTA